MLVRVSMVAADSDLISSLAMRLEVDADYGSASRDNYLAKRLLANGREIMTRTQHAGPDVKDPCSCIYRRHGNLYSRGGDGGMVVLTLCGTVQESFLRFFRFNDVASIETMLVRRQMDRMQLESWNPNAFLGLFLPCCLPDQDRQTPKTSLKRSG